MAVGSVFLLVSSVLRAWTRINLRLPVYNRPLVFQKTRFPLFLSMIWNGLWVLGVLMLFMSGFLIGLLGLIGYFALLVPGFSRLLTWILRYDAPSREASGRR